MSTETNLYSFPKNEDQALAMLYIQNQDLSELTPEDIYDKYHEAYKQICKHHKEVYQAERITRRSSI